MQFCAILEKRAVPVSLHPDYLKWLRYYLDFRSKYKLPDSRSEHVRIFVQKLRDKGQTSEQQKQAAHAFSLFFESQPKSALSHCHTKPIPTLTLPLKGREIIGSSSLKGERPEGGNTAGVGSRFNEWRCLEKTGATDWDKVIEYLDAEIKTRHYSRKTVAASTQNQAFNALLFLYRHILKQDFGIHKDIPRAKRSRYIPVVLSRQEIDAVLKHLDHPYSLAVKLLYGCGLRLFECVNLRVQNFNFDAGTGQMH